MHDDNSANNNSENSIVELLNRLSSMDAGSASGVNYLGICCGAGPHHIRSMAEALGRRPPASRYSPDMSKHAYQGTDDNIPDYYKKLGEMYE